ncbi:MAG TPA: hypothetical protein VHN16_17035 [Streptosporangiaceae bacterium]|nr:hypothetical protein [Streptosporangiaceae bacterium]
MRITDHRSPAVTSWKGAPAGSPSAAAPGHGRPGAVRLLYFADTPGQTGSALILDNQTAWIVTQITGMEHLVNERNRSKQWTAYRYGVYLAWMTTVSGQLQVRPDFLEYALFLEAKRSR